jgi:hypothetical protein
MRLAEIELREIAMQVLLSTVLIGALHAALEYREHAFNGVGVHVTANVFFLAVVHSLMVGKVLTDRLVRAPLVSLLSR